MSRLLYFFELNRRITKVSFFAERFASLKTGSLHPEQDLVGFTVGPFKIKPSLFSLFPGFLDQSRVRRRHSRCSLRGEDVSEPRVQNSSDSSLTWQTAKQCPLLIHNQPSNTPLLQWFNCPICHGCCSHQTKRHDNDRLLSPVPSRGGLFAADRRLPRRCWLFFCFFAS